jgi:2,4-dienoyl-CoA reductase-like NADH-dependent reductase (Old Yellow Enzyme family)/thioredoxin reductase
MSKSYEHLLSPYKIGNVVFRNRMSCGPNDALYLQGPEDYITDPKITWVANIARGGAAWVVFTRTETPPGYKLENLRTLAEKNERINIEMIIPATASPQDHKRWAPGVSSQHYISQLAEAVHFYGAKMSAEAFGMAPPGYDVSAGIPPDSAFGEEEKEIPDEMLEEVAENIANHMEVMKVLGHDMCFLHMAYRMSLMGRMLSPLINKRKDKYGGSMENRARFPIMVADRIKQRCGQDFIIEASISGSEPPGGYTLDDAVEYAKMFAGHIDILQLREHSVWAHNLCAYYPESNPTPTLRYAEAIKKSGAKIAVEPIGGFTNPDWGEEAIASGKADFIGMTRAWTSNPNFGTLVYEGRTEDIVPCIRCNKCHCDSYAEPRAPHCSVNPVFAMEWKIDRMISPPTRKKKVAVVGGGLAGMKAALVAAERGHDVTLYEKSDGLGGIIRTVSMAPIKWTLKNFMNYMYRQIEKSNVKVLLSTEATPEILKKEQYDAVLAAVGAEPIVPDIPGVDGKNVVYAPDVFGNEDSLGENVVVIGGGETGVETALHLAEKGHKVTVVEMDNMLAADAPPVDNYTVLRDYWEAQENFSYVVNARCNSIAADKVTYVDADGKEHAIKADSVVIAVGMRPKNDLALKFHGVGGRLYMIGDCDKVGNVQRVMRSAFSTASLL